LICITLIGFFLLELYLQDSIFNVIDQASSVDMSFRVYDTVPSFAAFGLFGSFLRMVVWPLLVASGLFVVFSPSIQFFLVSLGCFSFTIVGIIFFKRFYLTLLSFSLLALTSSVTTGFTSFVRYSLPIQCLSYLIVFSIYEAEARPRV
jgi:hypothetical protein